MQSSMKRLLLAAAIAAGSIGSAQATDLPVKAPVYKAPAVAVPPSWTGWYAGINAGYGFSSVSNTFNLDPPTGLPIDTIKYKGKDEIKLSFNNNQNGSTYDGFEITFTMSDLTGKGYGFFFTDPKRPEEAFWAKSVDSAGSCPTTQSSLPHIKAKFVDRNTLVVVNPNGHLEYFGFALALSKAGETAPSVIIDPIGDNQDSQLNVNLGTGGIG